MAQSRLNWRSWGQALLLTAAFLLILSTMDKHFPIEDWLFLRYAWYWGWSLVVAAGCLGVGDQLVRLAVGRIRGLHAHYMVAFTIGLMVFGLLVFALGLMQLLGPWMFRLLPLAMVAVGSRRLVYLFRRVLPRVVRNATQGSLRAVYIPVWAFGFLCWLYVYVPTMAPDNIMFDSAWKHVALAESFAANGGIFRYPEGWIFAARPHFATYLYTWGFLIPGGRLFDQIEMCAQIEFIIFAFTTMVGVPALVRRVVPTANPWVVWVARFLMPGVLLYDSNLSIGADHIGATFGVPIFIVTYLVIDSKFKWGASILLGALLAGAVMTKETAAAMLLPVPVLVVAIAVVKNGLSGKNSAEIRRRAWACSFVVALAAIAISSPLWLKNVIWYGDPLYPTASQAFGFTPKPWFEGATYMFEWGYKKYQFAPWVDEDSNRLLETIKVLFTWSFVPHDWGSFHGKRPVIGHLVTILVFVLPFLRGTRGLWRLALWIHAAIIVWFQILPQDRYLQAMMPLMTAFIGGTLTLAWRQSGVKVPGKALFRPGLLARYAIFLVVAAQVITSLDVTLLHRNRLKHVINLIAAGKNKKKRETRLKTRQGLEPFADQLPEDARLIVHEVHPHLGSNRVTYPDFHTWQFGLDYGALGSPTALWEAYREMGITHVFWKHGKSRSWDSVAGDLIFFDFVLNHLSDVIVEGRGSVGQLYADAPDPEDFEDSVVLLGCNAKRGFRSGLYRLGDLHVPMFGPKATELPLPRVVLKTRKHGDDLHAFASYAAVDPKCWRRLPAGFKKDFKLAAKRKRVGGLKNRGYHLYLRKRGAAAAWPKP